MVTKDVDEKATHTISGLFAYAKYSVRVAAKNANGTGPFSIPELQVSGEHSEFNNLPLKSCK